MAHAVWDWTPHTVTVHHLAGDSKMDNLALQEKSGIEILLCHQGAFLDDAGTTHTLELTDRQRLRLERKLKAECVQFQKEMADAAIDPNAARSAPEEEP